MMDTRLGHTVEVRRSNARVIVQFNGQVVADTKRPLLVREIGYAPVYYLPEADVRREFLESSSHRTHCPYKGDATHFDLVVAGRRSEKALWAYERPMAAVSDLAGHLAFYPDRVDDVTVERLDE